jgi:hypothetical protein
MADTVESTTKKNITMKKALIALFVLLGSFCLLSVLQGYTMYSVIKDTRVKDTGAMTTKEGQAISTSVNQLVVSPAALAFMPNEIASKVELLTYKGPDGTETINKRVSSTTIKHGESILYRTTEGDTLFWSIDDTKKIKVTSSTGATWEHCIVCDACTITNVFAEDEEVLAAVDAFEDAVNMSLHEDGRMLQSTCESGCDTEEPTFEECRLYHVNDGDPALDSPNFDRESWLARFKPCGWYKANCGDMYTDVQTISANVDYMGGRDWLNPSDDELIRGRTYVVEFDVGIHPNVLQRFNDQEDSSLLMVDVPNIVDLTGDSGYRTNIPVEGETCLEIPVVANDDWGSVGPDYGNVAHTSAKPNGDLISSHYDCMGRCGECNVAFGGMAKDCMKHDVCSAFKSILTEEAAYGFCKDIDCGDEALHTVVGCFRKKRWFNLFGQREVCDEADFNSEPDKYFADITWPAEWDIDRLDGDACKLFDSWEMGQGVPSTLRLDDQPCGLWTDCLSGRCESVSGFGKRCRPRKPDGDGCSENTDCISGRCEGVAQLVGGGRCRARLSSAEFCTEDTDCLTDKCCSRDEMDCTFCKRKCAYDEEDRAAVCYFP